MMSRLVLRPTGRALSLLLVGAASVAAMPAPRTATTVGFSSPAQSVLERAGATTITVELSHASATDVTVPFSVAGSADDLDDYSIDASPLVIPAGQTSGTIALSVVDDPFHEGDETVEVTLGAPINATLGPASRHTAMIHDARLGEAIDGLSPAQTAAFRRGRKVFEKRFRPSEGLGPFYNATSCASCHSKPVTGGAAELYRNFYLAVWYQGTPANQFVPVDPFPSVVVTSFGGGTSHPNAKFSLEEGRPVIPDKVFNFFPTISAQRNAIPVFGVGLFEFVSDQVIMALADPNDGNGDGISGEVNTQLMGTAVGRFGTKSQVNNIELFTRGPLFNQMGITTQPFDGSGGIVSMTCTPLQAGSSPNDPNFDGDDTPDPEMSREDLGDLLAFTRFLAPPPKTPFDDAALRGELLFDSIGCTKCHVPTLPSARGPVNAYTDLLIHDMGAALADEIRLGDNPTALRGFRTQPLWGVSKVGPYLHDGRAETLLDAILAHGGEAKDIRDDFAALTDAEREDILAFLRHL